VSDGETDMYKVTYQSTAQKTYLCAHFTSNMHPVQHAFAVL